jgi:Fe-S-cluster containining protein
MRGRRAPTLEQVVALHAEVDARATALAAHHGERLRCRRGCAGCCVDGLSVFEVEAERIRARAGELLATAAPHPPGACAFLDGDGACRIYADRPYVCRTQGLPLAWEEEEGDDLVELRDICALNEPGGPPLVELGADEVWRLGPFEGRLAALQHARDGGALRRVSLRSLFLRSSSEPLPGAGDAGAGT